MTNRGLEVMNELVHESAMMLDHLVGIRRKLHMRPELSYGEQRTSEIICEELDRLQIPWTSVGDYGVVGTIVGQHSDRMVLLRADMDCHGPMK